MPTERLAPDAVLAQANLSGTVADIQEPPDSPDAGWLVAVDNATNTDVRVSFPTPSGALSGTQTVRVLVRKSATGGSTPTAVVELWQAGALVATVIPTTTVTDPVGVILTGTFAASVVTNPAAVEVRVNGVAPGGKPADRRSIGVGAIEWTANIAAAAPNSGTAAGGFTWTDTATGSAPPVGGGLTVLISAAATPTSQDTYLRNLLTTAGHTVTFHDSTTNLPGSGYDCVVLSQSVSGGDVSPNDCDTTTMPVVYLEYTYNRIRMASTSGGSPPTSSTQLDITAAGNTHPITSGFTDPTTWITSSGSPYSTATTAIPAGASILATWAEAPTIVAVAVAEAGAALTTGTAPARRVVTNIATGVDASPFWTTDTDTLFVNMVEWAAAEPGPTVNSGTATGGHQWTGTAAGRVVKGGGAVGGYAFTGTAAGSTPHRGTATAGHTFTGTATGSTTRRGAATGSYTWASTATGAAPTVGTKAGTAAGTYGWVASATGTRPSSGTGTGTYAYAGTASGTAPTITIRAGTAIGAYTYTGVATGTSVVQPARNITIAASPITTDWAAMPTTANPTTTGPTACCVLAAGPVETTWTTGPTYLEEP